MIFLELVLQNFGPYLGRQVINFSPEKNEQPCPIILIGGMNGGGKTTLMDAMRLALYGQRAQCSTRGNLSYADFLSQCVNRNTPPTEKARIELAFQHIQEDQLVTLRVVRYWEKDPKEGKDTLGILVNDEWPDKALANTWDEFIENLLPLGISNLFLFDGEQVKELAELEAPPPLVVEAIQSLLGLELAERLALDLDILVSRKRKNLASQKQRVTLDEIEQRMAWQKEELEAVQKEKAALRNQIKKAEKKQKLTAEKFISEGGKIAAQRSQLDTQLEACRDQEVKTRQSLLQLAAGILPLVFITPLLEQVQTQAEKESRHQEIKIAYHLLQERDQRLLQYLKQLSLSAKKLDQIQSFLAQDNQSLAAELETDLDFWLNADAEALSQLTNFLNYDIKAAQTIAQNSQNSLLQIEAEIETLERQIAKAASPEIYEKLREEMNAAQGEFTKVQAAFHVLEQRGNELEKAFKKTLKELESYGEEALREHGDQHIIAAVAQVQETLKLFKEKLTLKKLNQLEHEVSQCFSYLLHKSDLVHRVIIETHSFSLSLYNFQGQLVPKHRLSAGEKQLLAIAFLWGLARVSGRRLPIAIDTPLGRLDSSHRQNLIERYFPSASHQVILLSTDTEVGKTEVENLRKQEAIAREYLLDYDSTQRQTTVKLGYFY